MILSMVIMFINNKNHLPKTKTFKSVIYCGYLLFIMSSKRKYASGYEKRKLKNKREENKKLSGSLSKFVNCSSSETVVPKNKTEGPEDLDVSISINDPEAEALTDDANDNKNTCIIDVNVENISEPDETVETVEIGDGIVNNSNNENKNKLASCKLTKTHTYYTLVIINYH
ncbi:uncharacterized protein LOC112691241 [Sipha flava]|uniref:Uncharacterized protein LOC112691241 n=1 Tax=Sipha flava TaxID=143950 RepID=A0A8B8GEV9_9HEMI|nr:uncharacterized protein LOC112691241 [Sipha flava]